MRNGGVGSHSGWKLEIEKEGKIRERERERERERMKILRTKSIIYPKIYVCIFWKSTVKEAMKE